jgi:ABC-type Fe3+-hydroxamate transport system substrate-binding protein
MISFTDQLGRIIHLQSCPKRIVSVVPSQTELLFDLGLQEEVIGITRFCVHPHQWYHNKKKVGGTKILKMEIIHSLKPDLIIANKEENTKEQIEALEKKYPVWISDVHDLETALEMIVSVGELTNKAQKAVFMAAEIKENFRQLQASLVRQRLLNGNENNELKTAYLIWKDPYMTVGGDVFIHAMLVASGLKNVFEHLDRYPQINIADLQTADCKLLLLSTEPYPFSQKHIEELQKHLPDTKIILVDGEMFSWYGSRLLQSAEYFQKTFQAPSL